MAPIKSNGFATDLHVIPVGAVVMAMTRSQFCTFI